MAWILEEEKEEEGAEGRGDTTRETESRGVGLGKR